MDTTKALIVAIGCIKAQRRAVVFNANLQKRYQANLPVTINAEEKLTKYNEAIACLWTLLEKEKK